MCVLLKGIRYKQQNFYDFIISFFYNNIYINNVIISPNKSLDICAQSYNLSKQQTIALTFFSVSHVDEIKLIKSIHCHPIYFNRSKS